MTAPRAPAPCFLLPPLLPLLVLLLFPFPCVSLAAASAPRRWFSSKLNSIDSLELVDAPSPAPLAAHEVKLAVETIGLNMADVWTVLGLYKAAPKEGVCPGLECCGTVVSAGSAVTNVEVGTRVMAFSRFGAYGGGGGGVGEGGTHPLCLPRPHPATQVTIDSDFVRPLPEGWTAEQGASFLVQGITAWHALVELTDLNKRCAQALASGEQAPVVLVHSAAGGKSNPRPSSNPVPWPWP